MVELFIIDMEIILSGGYKVPSINVGIKKLKNDRESLYLYISYDDANRGKPIYFYRKDLGGNGKVMLNKMSVVKSRLEAW
jgi:hypothetical protein